MEPSFISKSSNEILNSSSNHEADIKIVIGNENSFVSNVLGVTLENNIINSNLEHESINLSELNLENTIVNKESNSINNLIAYTDESKEFISSYDHIDFKLKNNKSSLDVERNQVIMTNEEIKPVHNSIGSNVENNAVNVDEEYTKITILK